MSLLTQATPDPKAVFGKINPPDELKPLLQDSQGGPGSGGISIFFNSLISLIFIVAGVIFIIMMLWGALQWIASGGDKEAVASARRRIVHAVIGIVILGLTGAIISTVGAFTGFKFFT